MIRNIFPMVHYFVDEKITMKLWVIQGCELTFLTSRQALEYRRFMYG